MYVSQSVCGYACVRVVWVSSFVSACQAGIFCDCSVERPEEKEERKEGV